MKQSQPELAAKLELYQDKCDDLLERYNLASSIRSTPKTKTIFDKN